ncbi:restriction endonuclease fold toxin 5 domain-containing protein [Methylovirgula sp. HY1]|uniref:restriction endonuclease fold toxin 5 domain-containing protein n=1 Tax=Methylovirgula sp. HY1 TaxID=2822761 RepID=UPI001C5A9350|nr:restriction endonuclease fold toxin 5 domain-containing protein [Methylovirgula sp. HY1]
MLRADEARLLTLLSSVYGRQISPRVMHHVARASEQWSRGDKALAHIELAFARLPRLETREDAFRLFLAENLLSQGMTPRRLTRALGFDPQLLKYDPNQPREPAGNGRPSGRWVRGDIGGAQVDASSSASGTPAVATSIVEETAPAAVRWLTSFAAEAAGATALGAAGAIAFAGFLVIPTPNSGGVYDGAVPTLPGVRYKFSEPTGGLKITATADDGETITFDAHRRDNSGVYYDAKGRALGRDVGTGLYIDIDAADAALRDEFGAPPRSDQEEGPESTPAPFVRPDEPKLCPDPSPDRGNKEDANGEKAFAAFYQEYVGSIVNPQLKPPLPAALGYALFDPKEGKLIVFDHCQLTTGKMIEAKGHYEKLLKFDMGRKSLTEEFEAQAERQIAAADANGGRAIEWHFYEMQTMEFARKIFKNTDILDRITLVYTPYPGNDEWPYPKDAQRSWAKGRQKP